MIDTKPGVNQMKVENHKINRILKALNNKLRREILLLLSTYGRLRYSEIMHKLNLSPENDSGWFAYHIKTLMDADLIKRGNGSYYLSRIGKKAVLLMEEIGKPEESISIKLFEGLARMTIADEIKATWALLTFLFGVLFIGFYAEYASENLILCLLGILSLIASIVLYVSLAVSLKSIYCLPIFFNLYWIFMRPRRWKEISTIILSGCLSIFLFLRPLKLNNFNLNLILSAFFFMVSILLSVLLLRAKKKVV